MWAKFINTPIFIMVFWVRSTIQFNRLTCFFNMFTGGNRCDGSVGRASAPQSEGRWFEPRPSHTKDFKNGTRCLSPLALEK